MKQERKTIQVIIQNQVLNIDARFVNVSALIEENVDLTSEQKEDDILTFSENFVTLETFEYIKKYYEYNNFEPKELKGTNNIDELFQNEHDKIMMMSLNPLQDNMVQKLYNAAIYLQLQAFEKLCLARYYYEFLVDLSDPISVQKLKNKFPEIPPINIQDLEDYKKKYPNLMKQFS